MVPRKKLLGIKEYGVSDFLCQSFNSVYTLTALVTRLRIKIK